MDIGVLGTGVVGETIATALTERKHAVMLGSRTANNEKAKEWVRRAGKYATQGTFNEAAWFGELLFLCLNGEHALEVVSSLEEESIRGKIIIDTTNPLDFTKGMPPRILDGLGNSNSLGEEIQRKLPGAFIVKALNTVTHKLMVNARLVYDGEHNLFICGNNAEAKNKVMHFLADNFHWQANRLMDLGGMEAARCTEAFVPLWVSVMQRLGTPMFSFRIVK